MSTLCKYDLRKGELFVLGWARERLVRRGSISSELLMCGVGVHSIVFLSHILQSFRSHIIFSTYFDDNLFSHFFSEQ